MTIQLNNIKTSLANGKIENAIAELSNIINQTELHDLNKEMIALSARFINNQKQKRKGLISATQYNIEWNKILAALNSILEEIEQPVNISPGNENTLTSYTLNPCIFISYNHADQKTAYKLKEALIKKGFQVIIDTDSMEAGSSIKEFIEASVSKSDITLSIVSNASLLSGWVGMETIHTFIDASIYKKKKFIACFLDDDFFNKEFTLKAVDKIDAEIARIEQMMIKYATRKIDTGDLNTEKTRLYDLRNNMNKIIGHLHDSLCIDIRDDQFNKNLPKIIAAICTKV